MTTRVEKRFEEVGHVVVDAGHPTNERRMFFAPAHIAVRKPELKKKNEPFILTTGNWGELTTRQKMLCKKALETEYPNRAILLGD